MQRALARLGILHHIDAKETCSAGASFDFFFRCFTHRHHLEVNANGNARERMVAIEHHMLGVQVRYGVEQIARRIGIASRWQRMPLEGMAFFEFGGKECTLFQKHTLLVKIAKGIFGL